MAFGLFAFPGVASAGPPTHQQLVDPIGGFAVNHACGTAVDSNGDIYVASAGASKIEVFDPTGAHLASIADVNEPCGLAVNAEGHLFVTRKALGKVVRYKPSVYPLGPAPTWGAAEPIDESGLAQGIAVDPVDERLYVAQGTRIAAYRYDGSFEAFIGEGELVEASGVAAYTYLHFSNILEERGTRYLYVADKADDTVKLFSGEVKTEFTSKLKTATLANPKFRRELSGPKAGEDFGFGSAGAYLAIDPGNRSSNGKCASVDEQACTAGHLLVYDAAHEAVDEFDASGEFLDQITAEAPIADGEPSGMAIDRSGGPNDGKIYVSSGAETGAKLLAFGPLTAPGRTPLGQSPPAPPSQVLASARSAAVDSKGNLYVAAGTEIRIYDSSGAEVTKFTDPEFPYDLAVDSKGRVYVLDEGTNVGTEKATYYTPSAYPPTASTIYARHEPPILKSTDVPGGGLRGIAVNSKNDHVFVLAPERTVEFGTPEESSPILNANFAGSIALLQQIQETGIGVCGTNGEVFIAGNNNSSGVITVISATGTEELARITGAGSPAGLLPLNPAIAVGEPNCHVLAFDPAQGMARELDARGAFVAEFGQFGPGSTGRYDITVESSDGPSKGRAYVVHDQAAPNTPDLWAFAPLSYGQVPNAATGSVSGLGAGKATFTGSVDPRGAELDACRFEYLLDADYQENIDDEDPPFEGASTEDCVESFAQIGDGEEAVPVHAEVEGLDLDGRYRFRLVGANKFGQSSGKAVLFGPPVLKPESAISLYDEALLRAQVEPAGLLTEYHFEYVTQDQFEATGFTGAQSTPTGELPPGEAFVSVEAGITGLKEGGAYRFRVVAENEAMTVFGPGKTLTTLVRRKAEDCPNPEYRGGPSANLPDCRAYELVTPAETGGFSPAANQGGSEFNNWLTVPRGAAAGERLTFFTVGTLPGFEGNGRFDGYRAERGAGAHPSSGWSSQALAPDFAQSSGTSPFGVGVSADQLYSAWRIVEREETFESTLPPGPNLRTPGGVGASACNLQPLQTDFEMVGCATLGTDTEAQLRYIAPGAVHVIFSSADHLAANAAPEDTQAIYDRAVGSSNAQVLSLKPGDVPFDTGEDATYLATNEDGSAVAFSAGGTLYMRRGGETFEVTSGATFAGISADGAKVTYVKAGKIFVFDAGSEPPASTEVALGMPVNVSSDGSHVFFDSTQALTGSEENENSETAAAGEHNLYAWDGATTRFIAILDDRDFEEFSDLSTVGLQRWTGAVTETGGGERASSPTRSTPDGGALVFQSHAQLTEYDNKGVGQVYRYDPAAAAGGQLVCVSCNPAGSPPAGADAVLQDGRPVSPVRQLSTVIANVTDGGSEVFFQSFDRLLPEDTNDAEDVYQWRAESTGEPKCERAGGCLALISTGQGEGDSYLFSMSADGEDVFFWTEEKLVGSDVAGSRSIYDARVEGGIPFTAPEEPCSPESCQGEGSPPPALPSAVSNGGPGPGGNVEPEAPARCAKGKHRVKGKGRCVKKQAKKRPRRKAARNRGTSR